MALSNPHLSEIPDDGLSLACTVLPEELQLEPEDARVRGEFDLAADIAKVGPDLHVTGVLEGAFIRQCVRCLNDYEEPAAIAFSVEYRGSDVPARKAPGRAKPAAKPPEEDASPENEEDVYHLAGERLELSEMLREHVILATPMQPLCREDCRGLCPVCGQNLNEGRCDCPPPRPDSPFSVLRKLTENSPRPGRS